MTLASFSVFAFLAKHSSKANEYQKNQSESHLMVTRRTAFQITVDLRQLMILLEKGQQVMELEQRDWVLLQGLLWDTHSL
jgi:hypothetical protein